MKTLASVFFHVDAGDSNALSAASTGDFDIAVLGKRLIVLRNLVALGEVWIEVILAREDRVLADLAVERHGREYRELYCLPIQHGQGTRQAETHRADIGVRGISELGRAAAEDFGLSQELDVDFESDDRLVPGLRRNRGFGRSDHVP
jgi:hypothetical protein